MTLTNTDTRQTHRLSFVNNNKINGIDRVITDIVEIDSDRQPQFSENENTLDFQVADSYVFIKTNLDYADKYKIEAWIDENTLARDITLENSQGKLSFKINDYLLENSRIRYTVYDNIVEQRQATSKALRKIQAEVDE